MADQKRTRLGPTGSQPVASPGPTASPSPSTSYLPAQTDPIVGQTLAGRYAVVRKLGEGGMGAVYLATHTVLDKAIALKVLHGEFARKQDLVDRFMQEAKSASRIRHQNVIDISDFGTTNDGLVFFAMELLQGHDLHDEIARAKLNHELLPWERSKHIFLQICSALAAAHAHGIIHRDLKPENVYLIDFLGDPDFVKLLDFGIAKLTEVDEGGRKLTKTGMLFGTPEYMSPEQARGEAVDARVDVYAMGCILYQLVCGRVPFEADNFMGVLSQHLTEPPPVIPPELFDQIGAPRALWGVIDRALVKDRHQRWSTIDELANAIRSVCGDPIPVAGTATGMPRQRPPTVPAPLSRGAAPTPAPIAPGSGPTRQRTQWTGRLSIPTEDEDAKKHQRSKWPLILAGALVAGGAAVGAVVLLDRGASTTPRPPPQLAAGSGSTSAVADASVPVDGAAALPPLPDQVKIRIETEPPDAMIHDAATMRAITKTPFTKLAKGSRDTISYVIRLKGYSDVIVDVTPDRDVHERIKLERGASGTPPKRQGSATVRVPADGSAARPDVAPPDAGPKVEDPVLKPDVTPDPVRPRRPDDDCSDPSLPCLKSDPSRGGAGEGSGSGG